MVFYLYQTQNRHWNGARWHRGFEAHKWNKLHSLSTHIHTAGCHGNLYYIADITQEKKLENKKSWNILTFFYYYKKWRRSRYVIGWLVVVDILLCGEATTTSRQDCMKTVQKKKIFYCQAHAKQPHGRIWHLLSEISVSQSHSKFLSAYNQHWSSQKKTKSFTQIHPHPKFAVCMRVLVGICMKYRLDQNFVSLCCAIK